MGTKSTTNNHPMQYPDLYGNIYLQIEKLTLSTRRRETFLNNVYEPRGVAVADGKVYYTDYAHETVSVVDTSGVNVTVMRRNQQQVSQLRYHRNRHDRDSNACSVNNGGCAELCLLGMNRQKTCACSTGQNISADGITCQGKRNANTTYLTNAGLVLGQARRRWTQIKPALVSCSLQLYVNLPCLQI